MKINTNGKDLSFWRTRLNSTSMEKIKVMFDRCQEELSKD